MVEDDETSSDLYRWFLASVGFRVATARTAGEALARARELAPSLILLDPGGSVGDGWEVARQLRADERTRRIPIVALSATPQAAEAAAAAGCDAVLVKPSALDQVESAIGRLLERRCRPLPERGSPRTVLVIDDDEWIRDGIAAALHDEGFVVVTAANGLEALALLRAAEAPPQLILLDLMMPVMNGWEFRAAQRRDPQMAEIPVVVLSAVADARKGAAELDVPDYLCKPVSLSSLLNAIERYC